MQQVHCWSGLGTGPGKGIQTILLSRPVQQLTAVLEGSSNEAQAWCGSTTSPQDADPGQVERKDGEKGFERIT